MVNLDSLAALDLLVWLGTTERAAALAHTNQSTVSRRSRGALQVFQLRLGRSPEGWVPLGDMALLAMERQGHQQARFLGQQPLRLQVPSWSRSMALRQLPAGWCANPARPGWVCDNPVQLLRDRVIDACLLTPTQLPERVDDLLLLDLYRRPIELTVFDGGRGAGRCSSARTLPAGPLHLRLLPFLPGSCRERSRQWFAALQAGLVGDTPDQGRQPEHNTERPAVRVAFLTPEMRDMQDQPWMVNQALDPYPYVERLAVLVDNAAEPAFQGLQEHLLAQFAALAA